MTTDDTLYANNRTGVSDDGAYEPIGQGGGGVGEAGSDSGAYSKATDGGIPVTPAPAATALVLCSYRSAKGRACRNPTATAAGAVFCQGHTCPTPACGHAKSSKEAACATCTRTDAGSANSPTAQQQAPEYLEPVRSNPMYSAAQAEQPDYLQPVANNPNYLQPVAINPNYADASDI